jgi:hypothetical protein
VRPRPSRASAARRGRARPGAPSTEFSWRKTVFTCRNQSCGTQWEQSDVVIKDEGQGLLFRCPLCGARNYLERFEDDEGNVVYEQMEGRPYLGDLS